MTESDEGQDLTEDSYDTTFKRIFGTTEWRELESPARNMRRLFPDWRERLQVMNIIRYTSIEEWLASEKISQDNTPRANYEAYADVFEWDPERVHSEYMELSGIVESTNERLATITRQYKEGDYVKQRSMDIEKRSDLGPEEISRELAKLRENPNLALNIERNPLYEVLREADPALKLLTGIVDGSYTDFDSMREYLVDKQYHMPPRSMEMVLSRIEELYGEFFEEGLEWVPEKIHSVHAEVSSKLETSSERIASLSIESRQVQRMRREYMRKHGIEYRKRGFIIRDPPTFDHRWDGLDPEEDAVHLAMERKFSEDFDDIESEIRKSWYERSMAAKILSLLDGIIGGSYTDFDSFEFKRAWSRVGSGTVSLSIDSSNDYESARFRRNEPYERPD